MPRSKLQQKQVVKRPKVNRMPQKQRRPFWLPAISFYVLSVAVAIAVFFLTWAVLIEGGEQNPFIASGLLASLVLIAAVVVREVVLRNARKKYYIEGVIFK